MTVRLFSSHCPKCKMLERELDKKGIEYEMIDDMDLILEFAKENNLKSAPILVVDDQIMKFEEGYKYVKEME